MSVRKSEGGRGGTSVWACVRVLKYMYTHTLDILAGLPGHRRAITIAVRVVDETPEKMFTHPRMSAILGGPCCVYLTCFL